MHVAILQFEMHIDGAQSLKDKRRVVRSIKDHLHKHHMVSVAEIAALEVWNLAIMGIVACNRSGAYLQQVMDNIVAKLRTHPDARLGECSLEIVSAETITAGDTDENGEPLWTEAERRDAESEIASESADPGSHPEPAPGEAAHP